MSLCRLLLFFIMTCSGLAVLGADSVVVRYDNTRAINAPVVGGALQDGRGLIWIATWNGLVCFDGYDFHRLKVKPGDGTSIASNRIRDISLTPDGNILCHTDHHLFEFDLSAYAFRELSSARRDSLQGFAGQRWPGMTDAQDNRWLVDSRGLFRRSRSHHPARRLPHTAGTHVRSLLVDTDSCLWVGSRADSTVRVYGPDLSLRRSFTLPVAPYCIFKSRSGDVWVGCKPGALYRNGIKVAGCQPVYDIAEDSDGRLWLATFGGGLRVIEHPDARVPVLSAPVGGINAKVRRLLLTPSGGIIAATTRGLLTGRIDSLDFRRTALRTVMRDGSDPESLSSDDLMSLALDADGHVFVATESSGIDITSEQQLMSGSPRFAHLNHTTAGLPSDVCMAMTMAGDSVLIVVGPDCVTAYNTRSDRSVNYGRAFWADSCRFAETTPVVLPDGSLIAGADEGAFVASRHNIDTRGYIPPIVFTTLSVNGSAAEFSLPPRQCIRLDAPDRNLTIGFAALDYTDNSGIVYRTRLDGSPWTGPDAARSVALFGLTPGKHTLEVQSTDRYGRWVDNMAALTIEIDSYWHETWWARLLFVLIPLTLIAIAVCTSLYIRRINRHRRELLDKYTALISRHDAVDTGTAADSAAPVMPEQPAGQSIFLSRVRRYIEANIDNTQANIDDMAAAAAVSRSTLNRHLRAALGVTATQLLIEARMKRAERLLEPGPDSVADIADVAAMCGYTDVQYFQRVFRKHHGMSASDFRTAGK